MNFAYCYKTEQIKSVDVRFIGVNTSDGFRWCLNGIPDEGDLKRAYIIKGAAGTGKSTLMKNVAEHFENAGTQIVRFLCSSDPDSLDAVLIGASDIYTSFIPGRVRSRILLNSSIFFAFRDARTAVIIHLLPARCREAL